MIEVEVKFRIPSEESSVIERLPVGAKPGLRQVDVVYLLGKDSFSGFVPGDPVVRLRDSGGQVTLTTKRRLGPTNSAEAEVEVSSFTRAAAVLELQGWRRVTTVDKVRRENVVEGVVLCVDEVMGLGTFVEIELVVEDDSDLVAARQTLMDRAAVLGLEASWIETKKYDELMSS